jgi:hypothetical protein
MRPGGWGVLLGLASACGGSTFTPDGGATHDAAPDGSGSTDGGGIGNDGGSPGDASSSPCPSAAPADASACGTDGLECEYGSNPVPECNTVATCDSAHWAVQPPTTGDACPTMRSPSCPASFSAASPAVHCEPLGLVCDFAEGRCDCSVGGGPVPLDASAAARWHCQTPGDGCPEPRPGLGTPCTTEGTSCDYGSCTVQGGSGQQCHNGTWQTEAFACAL